MDGCSNEAIVCLCSIVVCMLMNKVFYNNSHSFCLSTFQLDTLFTLYTVHSHGVMGMVVIVVAMHVVELYSSCLFDILS